MQFLSWIVPKKEQLTFNMLAFKQPSKSFTDSNNSKKVLPLFDHEYPAILKIGNWHLWIINCYLLTRYRKYIMT